MLNDSSSQKLTFKQTLWISGMLFGLFFGAGNLIFPIYMGSLAGSKTLVALIGFLITGVSLPLLGVTSIGVSKSEGLIGLSAKVGKGYSYFFTCALYLTIGPFFAIPRCATVPYTVAIEPLFGGANTGVVLAIFSAVFFAVVLVFSLFPGKILTWVGKILTPLFLGFLSVLVIAAIIKPMGKMSTVPPVGDYAQKAFTTGFLEGYNTMDALASLAFGIIIIDVLREHGINAPAAIAKNTAKAGSFCCVLMALIYLFVSVIGAQSGAIFSSSANGGEVFQKVSKHYFGNVGIIILAFIVTLACLKTAVGLVTGASGTFKSLFPNFIPYKAWAVVFSVVSFLIANLGLTAIINYSIPVLMFLYPLAITLILLGLFGFAFGHRRCVYLTTTVFTLIAAVFDFIAALPKDVLKALRLTETISFMKEYVPLFKYGLGWLIPTVIGVFVGLVIAYLTGKRYSAAQPTENATENTMENTAEQ